jgi:signal transduction histidine kinase
MEQEFTASMSHELRLPITVIKAIGDNLASGVVKDEKRLVRYGQEISGKADRLNTMVEGILMYSGLQQHRKVPILSKLDAEALIQEVLLEMKMLEGWDNISFTYSVQTGEIPIFADTEGVLRIVKNLLANAYYHGIPEQEGENPSIVLKLYRKPLNTLCIIVEDNGPGIPKNRQAKVLDPFYRLKRSIDNQIPGSGLGLYIVKRTAELNNGKFILESPYKDTRGRISQGCRFIVEIFIEERNDGQ